MKLIHTRAFFSAHNFKRLSAFFALSLISITVSAGCTSATATETVLSTYEEAISTAIVLNDMQGKTPAGISASTEYIVDAETGELRDFIVLDGFVNACAAPPCQQVEGNIGTFTITEHPGVFAIIGGGTTISLNIPDQPGAASELGVPLVNLTLSNIAEGSEIHYEVIVHYNGLPVAELVANLGGIADLIMVELGSQTEVAVAVVDDNDVTISGLFDPLVTQAGMVTVNTADFPAGYYATSYSFNYPDGEAGSTLSDTLSIVEGDESIQGVTAENEVVYHLNIQLTASPAVVDITRQELSVSVTDTRGTDIGVIESSKLDIDEFTRTITILAGAGLSNFNSNAISLIAGYLSVSDSSSIKASNNYAGGIAGSVSGSSSGSTTINSAFAATTVSGSSDVGGVVGGNQRGEISNSVFIGTITATILGGVLASSYNTTSISNSYAAATMTGTTIYGLAPTSDVNITDSYYDNTVNTSALQTPTTPPSTGVYAGWTTASWDFGADNQYPMLKGLPLTASEQCSAADAALSSVTLDCTVG